MDAQRLRLVTDDTPHLQIASPYGPRSWRERSPFRCVSEEDSALQLRRAIARGRQSLLAMQQDDGSFRQQVTSDPRPYCLLLLVEQYLDCQDESRDALAVEQILELQSPDGTWSRAPGESCDPSTTVLAYFALKTRGRRCRNPEMQSAFRAILSAGGAAVCDAPTRLMLALLGQVPFLACGNMVEVEPFSQLIKRQPSRQLPANRGIRELFTTDPVSWPEVCWSNEWADGDFEREIFSLLVEQTSDDSESTERGGNVVDQLDLLLAQYVVDETDKESVAEEQRESRLLLRSSRTEVTDTAKAVMALCASGISEDSDAVRAARGWLSEQLALENVSAAEQAVAREALTFVGTAGSDALPPALELWAEVDLTDGSKPRLSNLQSREGAFLVAKADPALAQGLRESQQADGCWREFPAAAAMSAVREVMPADPVGATAAALSVLAGDDASGDAVAAGINWLCAYQQCDGGWAVEESLARHSNAVEFSSYGTTDADDRRPVPIATAQVMLALLDNGFNDVEVLDAAAEYLMDQQLRQGGWAASHMEERPAQGQYWPDADFHSTCLATWALSRWATRDPQVSRPAPVSAARHPTLRIAQLTTVS